MNNPNLTLPFQFLLPTRIVYGPGCLKELPAELKAAGGCRPILVTDSGVQKAGLARRVTALLGKQAWSTSFMTAWKP